MFESSFRKKNVVKYRQLSLTTHANNPYFSTAGQNPQPQIPTPLRGSSSPPPPLALKASRTPSRRDAQIEVANIQLGFSFPRSRLKILASMLAKRMLDATSALLDYLPGTGKCEKAATFRKPRSGQQGRSKASKADNVQVFLVIAAKANWERTKKGE